MAKNTCKLCFRRFASPRALAGHMRSHSVAAAAAAAAAAATAAARKQQISSASSASTSFTAAADEDVGFKKPASVPIYTLRENPKRSVRASDVAAFSDRESEAESTPPPEKRAHVVAGGEAEPVSSLSDAATPEEEVARSLVKLSQDSWPPAARGEIEYDDGSDDGYAYAYTPPSPAPPPPPPVEKRTRFQCPACKKVFRSYQALGGHRASHVRGGRGGCCAPPVAPPQPQSPLQEHDRDEGMDGAAPPPRRECPHCPRVFPTGQALGAHMRSHVRSTAAQEPPAAAAAAAPAAPISKFPGMIDLNVALPIEEVELSAVSDPGA